jgi:asparagine synthase (glutamine-hydrolysing)
VSSEADLETMLRVLFHRGPDGSGTFIEGAVALGHRRLKIIDLSDHARQPIADPNGLVVITFNGEIYNYRELRAELRARGHRFRGTGDSEMLPAAYLEWGEGFVERLRGMFALALYDRRDKRVLLARDRLGIKPLYHAHCGGALYFASEIKALLAIEGIADVVTVDHTSVASFFSRGYQDRNRTWFDGILSLEPGTIGTVGRTGALSVRRFWSLPERGRAVGQDPAPRLRELLGLAADDHLQSDVPVGAHCSGGIDSSTLVALLAPRTDGPLRTFSVAYAEGGVYDERPYIDHIVSRFGTEHHVTIPTAEDAWDALPHVIEALDEPIAGVGSIPQYLLSRDIRSAGVIVVNGGQGGDELFAGYRHHLLPYAFAEVSRTHALAPSPAAPNPT